MAIKHTAVSYYGFNYTEHAEKDFIEMKEHGCDTVILAITEFDMDFWFPNINEIVKTAHNRTTFTTGRSRPIRARCSRRRALTRTRSGTILRTSA